jgi:hypothetical protein
MTRNELLELANGFYTNGGVTEREIAFARVISKAAATKEREAIAQMFEDAPALVPFAQNDKGGCMMCGFTPARKPNKAAALDRDAEIERLNEKIEFLARTNMLYSDWEHRDTQVTSDLIRKGIAAAKLNAELLSALVACLNWMEQMRDSGDAGNWEWKDDAYTKGRAIEQALKGKNT